MDVKFTQIALAISVEWTPEKTLKVWQRRLEMPYIKLDDESFVSEIDTISDERSEREYGPKASLELSKIAGLPLKDVCEYENCQFLLFTGGPQETTAFIVSISLKTQ
mmetsp:Transcript_12405/g.14747  ORF Transcript_12405/g.14747 Transcript_12405/m.14747 type:complete len:107 (+) Transcript_12405:987-1307(+)